MNLTFVPQTNNNQNNQNRCIHARVWVCSKHCFSSHVHRLSTFLVSVWFNQTFFLTRKFKLWYVRQEFVDVTLPLQDGIIDIITL